MREISGRYLGGVDHDWLRRQDEKHEREQQRLRARQRRCPGCGGKVPAHDGETFHRCPGNKVTLPSLFFRGRRLSSVGLVVGGPSTSRDWVLREATTVVVNGNGMSPGDLPELLGSTTRKSLHIVLHNGLGEQEVRLSFAIAEEQDLDAADQMTWRLALEGVDRQGVDDLIAEIGTRAPTADHYLDGLSAYMYGVAARNGDAITRPCVELFERAAVALAQYERPMAEVIGGIIAFHLNTFGAMSTTWVGGDAPAIETAIVRLRAVLSGERPDLSDQSALLEKASPEAMLMDRDTRRVLRHCLAPLSPRVALREPSQYDRFKLDVMTAEAKLAEGDQQTVRDIISRYRNHPELRRWADSIVALLPAV